MFWRRNFVEIFLFLRGSRNYLIAFHAKSFSVRLDLWIEQTNSLTVNELRDSCAIFFRPAPAARQTCLFSDVSLQTTPSSFSSRCSSDVTLSRSLVDLVRRTFYGDTHDKCSMMWRHLRSPSSDRIYSETTSGRAPRSIVNTTLVASLTQTTSKSLDSSKRSSLHSRTNFFCGSEIRLHLCLDQNCDATSMHLGSLNRDESLASFWD